MKKELLRKWHNRKHYGIDFNVSEDHFNYLVNFSVQKRFIYVETPKVGCSSIKTALQELVVTEQTEGLPDNVHDKSASPLLSPNDARKEFSRALKSPNVTRFSFVRNPFTRVLSCYLDKVASPHRTGRENYLTSLGFDTDAAPSFADFLKAVRQQPKRQMNVHWTPQSFILKPETINYDFIGRFENFDADLAHIMARLRGNPGSELPPHAPHATGASQKVRDYIGPTEKQLILELYEDDFKTFDYSPDLEMV